MVIVVIIVYHTSVPKFPYDLLRLQGFCDEDFGTSSTIIHTLLQSVKVTFFKQFNTLDT